MDEILVVDNGSDDGTDEVLRRLARRHRVRWTRDDSGYRQAEIVTGLAREAHARGAEWVVPFDADELWLPAGGSIRAVLAATEAAVLTGEVRNFVQAREVRQSGPGALLTMTRRVAEPVGPMERCEALVEAGEIAFVEMLYAPKVVVRAGPDVEIALGSHAASGVEGAVEAAPGLLCLHAPLRSREALEAKAEKGRRADEAGHEPGLNWHLRRWARLAAEGGLDAEWRANSHLDGELDLAGRPRPLLRDTTLSELAARHG